MSKLLVSLCIPTHNGAQFITDAMDSAISQTYPNLEIVVSDDESLDDTIKIIESYKTKTSIPIHIYQHKPQGIGANWNNCIKKANGVYIKFLFQDDILLPECITKMVDVLENNKKISLVASKREIIVEASYLSEDSKIWIKKYGDLQQDLNLSSQMSFDILDKKLFKCENFLKSPLNKVGEPSTVLFRKSMVQGNGYFREDLVQVLDYEFYYRILKRNKIAIIKSKLVKFRLHNLQATMVNAGSNSLDDDDTYYKIIYNRYFWYLNKRIKIVLLKQYNPIVKLLLRVKQSFMLTQKLYQ